MFWVSKAIVENVNGIVFLGGACWLYMGVAGFSPHAADVAAGAVFMAIGAYPYLKRKRKS